MNTFILHDTNGYYGWGQLFLFKISYTDFGREMYEYWTSKANRQKNLFDLPQLRVNKFQYKDFDKPVHIGRGCMD